MRILMDFAPRFDAIFTRRYLLEIIGERAGRDCVVSCPNTRNDANKCSIRILIPTSLT